MGGGGESGGGGEREKARRKRRALAQLAKVVDPVESANRPLRLYYKSRGGRRSRHTKTDGESSDPNQASDHPNNRSGPNDNLMLESMDKMKHNFREKRIKEEEGDDYDHEEAKHRLSMMA